MRSRVLAAALLAAFAAGCGGGSGGGASSTTAAATATPVVGRVEGAPANAVVFLVVPDAQATSVVEQAGTLVDSADVQADGSFALPAVAGAAEVLVSAPGLALTRVALAETGSIALAPEARLDVEVTGLDGRFEPLAMALVLDAQGRALPVPAEECIAGDAGRLILTRLPAGRWEVLVASADGLRHARASVVVATGERTRLPVALAQDDELARRFIVAVTGEDPLPDAQTVAQEAQ